MKKITLGIFFFTIIFLLPACQPATPACPPGSVTYLSENGPSQFSVAGGNQNRPGQQVEIKGQEIWADLVVQGVLCSGSWSGTVYVPCQVQVYTWEEDPLFLENCDLNIAPGTIVYVAAHNDEPYYQGCSCHTGEVLD